MIASRSANIQVQTVDIVIPVLNEAHGTKKACDSLLICDPGSPIISGRS